MTIVTGMLGSGKTTLLRHIVRARQRIAIVMNEFGEVAIDSRIVEGKHIRIAELAGGCVCCSLMGEFEAAVKELIGTASPERIVVETTGVAEPDGLILDTEENLPDVRLDGVIAVADADAMIRFASIGRTAQAQLSAADLILINKTDLIGAEELGKVDAALVRLNARALRVRAVRCQVEPEVLFGLERPAAEGSAGLKPPGPHQPGVEVVSFVTDRPLDRPRFIELIGRLPREVYRAKGFIQFARQGALFNYVGGRWDEEPWAASRTELVFLGQGLSARREVLLQWLRRCEGRP